MNLTDTQIQKLIDHLEDYIHLMKEIYPGQNDVVLDRAKQLLEDCRRSSREVIGL